MLRFALVALIFVAALPTTVWPVDKGGRMRPLEVEGVINEGRWKTVALTFDACPRPKDSTSFDPAIIEILRKEKVPATLFISGLWALRHPDLVKDLAADPLFEIGNHGHKHVRMVGLQPEQYRQELAKAQAVLKKLTGGTPRIWRPPYGEVDTGAVHAAVGLGLTTVNFSLSSGDPDPKISTKRLVRGVVENARPGSIVVMHMNGNGVKTAEALPKIIEGLRKRGFQFVKAGDYVAPPVASAHVH